MTSRGKATSHPVELPARRPNRAPTHPGAILREDVLPAIGMTVTAAAERLHVTRQTLHRILSEKAAVTPEMAVRLGRFLGNGAGIWVRMQAAYDLWQAENDLSTDIRSIRRVRQARG